MNLKKIKDSKVKDTTSTYSVIRNPEQLTPQMVQGLSKAAISLLCAYIDEDSVDAGIIWSGNATELYYYNTEKKEATTLDELLVEGTNKATSLTKDTLYRINVKGGLEVDKVTEKFCTETLADELSYLNPEQIRGLYETYSTELHRLRVADSEGDSITEGFEEFDDWNNIDDEREGGTTGFIDRDTVVLSGNDDEDEQQAYFELVIREDGRVLSKDTHGEVEKFWGKLPEVEEVISKDEFKALVKQIRTTSTRNQ